MLIKFILLLTAIYSLEITVKQKDCSTKVYVNDLVFHYNPDISAVNESKGTKSKWYFDEYFDDGIIQSYVYEKSTSLLKRECQVRKVIWMNEEGDEYLFEFNGEKEECGSRIGSVLIVIDGVKYKDYQPCDYCTRTSVIVSSSTVESSLFTSPTTDSTSDTNSISTSLSSTLFSTSSQNSMSTSTLSSTLFSTSTLTSTTTISSTTSVTTVITLTTQETATSSSVIISSVVSQSSSSPPEPSTSVVESTSSTALTSQSESVSQATSTTESLTTLSSVIESSSSVHFTTTEMTATMTQTTQQSETSTELTTLESSNIVTVTAIGEITLGGFDQGLQLEKSAGRNISPSYFVSILSAILMLYVAL